MSQHLEDDADELSIDEFLLSIQDTVKSDNLEYFKQLKELKKDIMIA